MKKHFLLESEDEGTIAIIEIDTDVEQFEKNVIQAIADQYCVTPEDVTIGNVKVARNSTVVIIPVSANIMDDGQEDVRDFKLVLTTLYK